VVESFANLMVIPTNPGFHCREAFFDRIEIRRIGREIYKLDTTGIGLLVGK
jgi:hypothetical protein